MERLTSGTWKSFSLFLHLLTLNVAFAFPEHVRRLFSAPPDFSSPDGKVHRHSILHTDNKGRHIHLAYHAHHPEHHNVLSLDAIPGLHDARLFGSLSAHEGATLQLRFNTSSWAWKCTQVVSPPDVLAPGHNILVYSGDTKKVVKEILRVKSVSPWRIFRQTLVLQVIGAGLTDAFKHLDLTFTGKFAMEDNLVTEVFGARGSTENREPGNGGFEDGVIHSHDRTLKGFSLKLGLRKFYTGVKDMGKKVEGLIKTVQDVVELLTTGNLNVNDLLSYDYLNFNYDKAQQRGQCSFDIAEKLGASSTDVKGTCKDCHAFIGWTLRIQVTIANYKLQIAKVVVNGLADFAYDFDVTLMMAKDFSWSKRLYTSQLKDLQLTVGGVPVKFDVITPIDIGMEGSSSATLKVSGDYMMKLNMTAGLQVDGNLNPKFIHDFDFERKGSGITVNSFTGSVVLKFFLLPVPYINVHYLGGPNIALTAYMESLVDVAVMFPLTKGLITC